jgi:hypothetical protein
MPGAGKGGGAAGGEVPEVAEGGADCWGEGEQAASPISTIAIKQFAGLPKRLNMLAPCFILKDDS